MSIRKMTFSLASLILILGLGFGTTSVLAHDAGDTTVDPHDTHPVLEAIAADSAATPPLLGVPVHGVHPVPTITLKPNADTVKGNEVIVLADDATTTDVNENTFTVIIGFDVPVAASATATEAAQTPITAANNWGILVLDADDVPIAAGATIDNSVQAAVADDNEAVITIADAGLPADMGDTHTIRIQLNANVGVFSLQKTHVDGVTTTDVEGGQNVASAIAEFTLVRTLTPDNMLPMITLTGTSADAMDPAEPANAVTTDSFDIMYTTEDADMDSVTVAAEISTVVPSGAMAHYTLDTSVDGTVTVNQADPAVAMMTIPAASVTVTLTPNDGEDDGTAVTFTVAFAAKTYTPPNQLPTATISTQAPSSAVTTGTFDIEYTTNDADMDSVTVAATRTVVPSGAMAHYTLDTSVDGTVTVNQATPDATTKTIPAASVTVTLTPNDGEDDGTAVTFTVAFAAKTYTDPSANMLADKGYVVVVRDIDNPPDFGIANPTLMEWADMPDLHQLFLQNTDGGGSLQLTATGVSGARKMVFSEIMWAVDERFVGADGYDDQQWIEIHNRSGAAVAHSAITITAKQGRPAPAQGLDLVSNVVGGGSGWIGSKGQNGNTGADDGSGRVEFISMYRVNTRDLMGYEKDGWNGDHWAKSSQLFKPNFRGTPGAGEAVELRTFDRTDPALTVVFNEVSNRTNVGNANNSYEWIELLIRSGNPHFENWRVSYVTAEGSETVLFDLPKLDVNRYDNILLITASDPAGDPSHPLAAGYNVTKSDVDNEGQGRDSTIRYYDADWKNQLPDDAEFVLMLRNDKSKTNHEAIQDIAGRDSAGLSVNTPDLFTNLWPLKNYPAPNIALNALEKDKVHRRQKPGIAGTRTADKADNADHVAMRDVGWTGIGYKRNAAATAVNGGTPGYPNNALRGNNDADAMDSVIVSEVMATEGDRKVPQWVELQNLSDSVGVNLNGWRVTITNHNEGFADDLTYTINLGNHRLPPKQNYLIVARRGLSDTNLPNERIHSVGLKRTELLLNSKGFQIKLEAKKDNNYFHVDTVGNLGAVAEGNRRPDAQSFEPLAWDLPEQVVDNSRVSLVRLMDKTTGKPVHADGTTEGALVRFDMSKQLGATLDSTYYGHLSDIGSPGNHPGGVLPVSLSKFRPERLKDTGEIVVRWITESELNNAGFNILRSENRDGEFTKVHFVAGQGTTSERTLYEWKDKSAKPNVVYYYQIQDVSLDGEVSVLATTHLRGNVSAAGKLTTTWGELKALQ